MTRHRPPRMGTPGIPSPGMTAAVRKAARRLLAAAAPVAGWRVHCRQWTDRRGRDKGIDCSWLLPVGRVRDDEPRASPQDRVRFRENPGVRLRPGTDLLVGLHTTARSLDEGAHLTHATWASWAPTRSSSPARQPAPAWTCGRRDGEPRQEVSPSCVTHASNRGRSISAACPNWRSPITV